MKRKHKKYSRPKRPFDKLRIDEETKIKKEFGLKNKKEIWRADARINSIRAKAKKLISANPEEQKSFINRLKKIGLNIDSIAEVLSLDKKDYLKRRLQTVLADKKIVLGIKSSRQLITHKKVLVNGKVVDAPSYIVPVNLEDKISLRQKKKKPVKKKEMETPAEEEKEEIKEGKLSVKEIKGGLMVKGT